MRSILEKLKVPFLEYGYKKHKNSFWKVENGFYKLIDFQKGTHGGNYYFINVSLHPIGLPKLLTNELIINEMPTESECIIRQRIEQIVDSSVAQIFKSRLVSIDELDAIKDIIKSISEVDKWLMEWGDYEKIANMEFEEAAKLLSVVPILKKKAFYFIKCYCAFQNGNTKEAKEEFERYLNEKIDRLDFQKIDQFLKNLLKL